MYQIGTRYAYGQCLLFWQVGDVTKLKTKRIYIAILLVIIILTQGGCGKISKTEAPTYGEVGDVVRVAFLTDKGFNDELSKHMTKEVFNKTNIYNTYPVNSPEYKKPLSVDNFHLSETSQKKDGDTVKVEMIYSVEITDSNHKSVGGSKDIPITFTVQMVDGGWIITNKEEHNATSITQATNTNQPIATQDHKIKVNKNGQTYGSLSYVTEAGQEPDLVQAVGVDGTEGYVKYSDMMGPEVNTLEEAAAYMKEKHGPRMIPLYTSDGQTVIGKYKAD